MALPLSYKYFVSTLIPSEIDCLKGLFTSDGHEDKIDKILPFFPAHVLF